MPEKIKISKTATILAPVIIIAIAFLIYLYNDKNQRINSYLQTKDSSLQLQFNNIYQNYKIAAENVYLSIIRNPDIIEIFQKIQNSDEKQKDLLRKKLFNMLEERYERIKLFGVWQFHFHLPNNDSFLRVHRPGKFGDNLKKKRYSVAYVNRYKKHIEGFEVGKIVHGFRFVYPIHDENKHLGSVEISMSSEILKQIIEKSYKVHIEFLLNKDIVEKKLWKKEIDNHYEKSFLNDQYLKKKVKDDHRVSISKKAHEKIAKFINTDEIFSVYDNEKNDIVTFLPIFNIEDHKKTAYIVSFEDDIMISRIEKDFITLALIFISLVILIIIFILKESRFKKELHRKIQEKTKKLEESNKELTRKVKEQSHILDTLNEGVIIYEDNKCININKNILKMFGFSKKEEILSKPFLFFLSPNDPIKEKLDLNCKGNTVTTIETQALKNDGTSFPILLKYHTYCTKEKCVIIVSLLDLTDMKEKEKQLMHQSRLAQMGEMISMIAHQWRQPLSAVSSTTNTLMLKTVTNKFEKEFFYERLQNISNYSQHLSSTIDDFRNFFKRNKEQREILLSSIADDSLRITQTAMENKDIKIIKDYKDESTVTTYANELRQVVLNLIKNSEDILIEKDIKEKWIKIRTYKENEHHILEVSDNGGGIPENIIHKIFEPYYSTKTNKDGTGLGLYMSKAIVEDHCKGRITVQNGQHGAIFKVIL